LRAAPLAANGVVLVDDPDRPQSEGDVGGSASSPSPSLPSAEKAQGPGVSPARSVSDGERRSRKPGLFRLLSSRARTLLAIAGGAALIGAVVLALALGVRSPPPLPVAHAAVAGGSLTGFDVTSADGFTGSARAGDAGEAESAEGDAAAHAPVWRVARLADEGGVALIEGVLGHRPLLGALAAAGLPRGEAQRVATSLGQVRDVDHLSPKDSFTVAREKATGRVVAYEVATSPVDVWQAREEDRGGQSILVARKLELFPEEIRVAKAVVVGGDLRASLIDAGLTPIDEMLALIDDALDGHAELSDIRPGARLRIVATQERLGGSFLRWSSLDAVEYFPATPNAPSVRVYRFDAGGDRHHGWFDAKGRQPYRGGFRSPVPLARIASRFNPHRMHPVLHVVMPHNGVDFAASMGAPVYATAAGVVSGVGPGGPCGNKVEISHAGGYTSVYCHLSRFAPALHVGQHVESRQLIAYVGQTGRVTGPHLHFGIRRGGVFIDPMSLRLDGVHVVPRARRDEFDRKRADLDAELDSIPLPAVAASSGEAPRPAESEETFYEEP
jgi:murein DD-endopeptidase MepM/ murein hydrolase activator NlpD